MLIKQESTSRKNQATAAKLFCSRGKVCEFSFMVTLFIEQITFEYFLSAAIYERLIL